MWMEIIDKNSSYIINANSYQFIRKGKDCLEETTIIFADERGNDLILIFNSEEERDDIYKNIKEFMNKFMNKFFNRGL